MSGGHLLQTSFRCRPVADVSPEREYVRLQEVTGPSSCSSTRVAFDPKRTLLIVPDPPAGCKGALGGEATLASKAGISACSRVGGKPIEFTTNSDSILTRQQHCLLAETAQINVQELAFPDVGGTGKLTS